jgi:4-oxalocrotonate tautomerase
MPTLSLKLAPPLEDPARLQLLASELTALTAQVLGKRPEVTAVLIEALPAGRWHVGGLPTQRPTALLKVAITAGTNSTAQKARFVRAAFDAIERIVAPNGGLEPARYIQVRELAATDWGYGGFTQDARRNNSAEAERQRP